jgi:zinc protease
VRRARLANGLSILAWPDDSVPSIALYLFYRAGSRNERPGLTGLSHFFEHMMFNGTRAHGPKEFDGIMERAGGRNNAYTTQDVTVYQDWFPPDALATVFELEADRMQGLLLDPEMIESERGVVLAERRSVVESNHHALMDERLWATAYASHPYRWPVIGWSEDIAAWRGQDLAEYYRTYYSPSNALLVAAGAFDAAEMLALAERTFGVVPGHAGAVPPVDGVEPPQAAERRAQLELPANLASFTAAWHVPPARHADYHALRLLETLLLSGHSSRLYSRRVDRERCALSVGGGFDLTLDPTIFVMSCELRDGETPARGEALLYDEVAAMAAAGPSEEELAKAKRMRLAEHYRGMKTISGRAGLVGSYEVFFGDYGALFDGPRAFERVTAADVARVASTYLTERNRSVVTLTPKADAA